MTHKMAASQWRLNDFLGVGVPVDSYVVILVNQPLIRSFRSLWHKAKIRACADGGANRLFDGLSEAERPLFLPTFIKGDLDSLRSDVRDFYSKQGVPIIHNPDQNSTDLTKCIEELEPEPCSLLVCGALSGRFDHIVQSTNIICSLPTRRIFLISDDSVVFLLPKGEHIIQVNQEIEGPTCGIIPFVEPARINTRGLRWNLSDQIQWSMGGQISTSNAFADNEVWVQTDVSVLWTVELKL